MRKVLYLVISLAIFSALFIFFQSNVRETQAVSNPPISNQQIDPEKEKFAPAKKMLIEAGVSFDPDILLSADWREKLEPAFFNSYEMQTTLRSSDKLKGVQIADTVVLPEKVELTGDLVIIANTIIYEGKNPLIEGVGKKVYIFPIKEAFPIGKTFESELRRQGISTDSLPEKGQRVAEKYVFNDKTTDGVITIKVNGQGPAEWLKAVKERSKQNSEMQNSVSPEDVCPPICNGDEGAPGGPGESGYFSGNYPPEPSNGFPVMCAAGRSSRGGDGEQGADVLNVGPDNAGRGKQGHQGGPGGIIIVDIPPPPYLPLYRFEARGGQGGDGGPGGIGAPGDNAQAGGSGGDGGDCPCSKGGPGDGGNGATGGRGGKGGRGGERWYRRSRRPRR